MGFNIETSAPMIAVFLQGILSFFSPCVLPLLPVYIGYLSGGTPTYNEDGTIDYDKRKVIINTLFFVIGISFAFFLLGMGFTTLGSFFNTHKILFTRIGGVLIILFGVYQLGFLGSSNLLSGEHRLPFNIHKLAMNPITALILGFTFSFAWTPCVGPMLTSVLIMASSAASSTQGFILIGVYTLGFVLPFLAVGLFAGTILNFFKKHMNLIKYTGKVAGVILILMGIMMYNGWMNGLSSYLSSISLSQGQTAPQTPSQNKSDGTGDAAQSAPSSEPEEEQPIVAAPDFTLTDQYGNEHTLSDYKGKVVFLNFWATWCGPCRMEMPDIQALYENYGSNEEDVVILGIANPKVDNNPYAIDVETSEVIEFLDENSYTYPVPMDNTGEIFAAYGVSSFPTTYMIDAEGNVFGYVPGMMTYDIMESIIKQTIDGKMAE